MRLCGSFIENDAELFRAFGEKIACKERTLIMTDYAGKADIFCDPALNEGIPNRLSRLVFHELCGRKAGTTIDNVEGKLMGTTLNPYKIHFFFVVEQDFIWECHLEEILLSKHSLIGFTSFCKFFKKAKRLRYSSLRSSSFQELIKLFSCRVSKTTM